MTHQSNLSMHSNQVPGVDQILFTEDTTVAGKHPETYYLSQDDWETLGEPEFITITVEASEDPNPPDDGADIIRDGTGAEV